MRPAKNDYAQYYETYISKVETDNPVEAMLIYKEDTLEFFNVFNDSNSGKPYGEGKWSYKETLGHITDAERIMAYRALCIARGEAKHLPGFDQDPYVQNAHFNERNLSSLIEEFLVVRESSLFLFKSFGTADLNKRGVANENEVTVLASGYIIAGHNKHHLEILKSFYYKNL
jgi:hypothetical protein